VGRHAARRQGKAMMAVGAGDPPAVAAWPLLAAPGNDLPAAIGGTLPPDLVLAAAHDLDRIMADLNQWSHRRCIALLAGGQGDAGGRLDPGPWLTGAHRTVHRESPLLAALDPGFARLAALPADGAALSADERQQFFDTLASINDGLRCLLADTWNRLANIDPLTGLGNRPAMLRRLSIECERHGRSQQPCCVAVIDLDTFKEVNDRFGHAAGDTVLRSIGGLLAAGVRPYDEVFRYGGDEFVLCLPSTDPRTAWAVVERLRLRIAHWPVPLKAGPSLALTVSIGLAPLTHDAGIETALEQADQALFMAKRGGRNRLRVAAG
jgi:diguanylate cyclase (GGDEF)-like protein